ncbi:class I SAM-dependent methyltransferase [Streptomyces roseoverticillatus]|uniref:class I SAM-dependent methyltransferase n=1 Tax=Streptomyces roseoverticillatus TaxID=66429 RepID=UPI0006943217|nr:class I SAM-dependent methyltransferase [Streptomyces roseoverticillatus]
MKPWLYTLLYKRGAAWEHVGVSPELRGLLAEGRIAAPVTPAGRPRALDLGCGTGANAVFLAQNGYDVVGVDFTEYALQRARERAREAAVEDHCRFVNADLSSPRIPGVEGPFDLLIDYGTLDDTTGPVRRGMVNTVLRLSRTGTQFFLWCFSADKKDLPLVARRRMSRLLHTVMAPGEEQRLFGHAFDIERLPDPPRPEHAACFLMVRR